MLHWFEPAKMEWFLDIYFDLVRLSMLLELATTRRGTRASGYSANLNFQTMIDRSCRS